MTTQMIEARKGEMTPVLQRVAEREGVPVEELGRRVADGQVVIPANIHHLSLDPVGIGEGLKTKVNANFGTSPVYPGIEEELEKLKVAVEAGADAVMDLSTGDNLRECRQKVLAAASVPVGTVPIYEAAATAKEKFGAVVKMDAEHIFEVIERQAAEGVDFMTVHCGVTQKVIENLQGYDRVAGVVSRGGAILTAWVLHHEEENPLYAQFDRLLEICLKYDVTLSLGDGLRPGCIADATDSAQVSELLVLGELVKKAWEVGVQVMVEGPGHVPLNEVAANVILQKKVCHGAPFYVLGPLVTDAAAGYDHIAAAIGGAAAAAAGADFLCYVTPTEHLGLPTAGDVREGVIATRIAAHAADLVKKVPGAEERDLAIARARAGFRWEEQFELLLDPKRARDLYQLRNKGSQEECSMCGEFCALKMVRENLKK